ncbi:glycosyltransferase family 4 protein [Microbacterium sp. W1N]|uniref:glycosyltransferase family 4 protein n=1 Tax=Microbacterium festucae TaxID=2977531 RepID=UPI0021C1EB5D|nr:glycosyltransferase family 1 protein [Microbacterium festucae]MCT9818761.1 glycosyltransferase family 4 protein [Microbacterium festucae]
MRILVDLLGFTGGRGGTETYVRELLPRLATVLADAELIVVTGRAGSEHVREFFPGRIETVPWVGADRATWALGEIAAVIPTARRVGADLIWSPANFGPLRRGPVRRVVSVHDVIYHEVRGAGLSALPRKITAWLMTRTARSAHKVLTVSDAAAASISSHLALPRTRIAVVHNGSTPARPVQDPAAALATLDLPAGRPIVLSAGNRMPHKNFLGLLDALSSIAPADRPLSVLVGGGDDDPLRPAVAARGLEADVVLPGWVSAEELAALYAVATVYACPSLTEGFGLPVVDAMRAGCLVIANDIPVLREVGGDNAFYADARDPESFGAALSRVLMIDDHEKDVRRAAGRSWSERFSWDAAALGVAAVLRSATEGETAGA